MPWWGWIVLGAALLAAESVVDAQFFLVFFGAAALITGALAALGLAGPVWLQWTIFGALCVVGAATFRRRLYARIRSSAGEVGQSTVGELAVAREPIAPGGRGQVELRGTVWRAHNTGSTALAPGETARVARVLGVELELSRDA
ncbi:MAG: NfeD family protein [Deltaproteobacteria bacterium]|nr:NfeD family protein [Deltaproteobacteria bacterium]